MVVSHSKKFLFFAFNKTGSSSIEGALRPYESTAAHNWLRLRYTLEHNPVIFKHVRPLEIQRLMNRSKWDAYFKFCFVRNPFERLVSLYSYHRQGVPETHPLATKLTFEDWISAGGSGSAQRLMSEFVCDDAGKVIVDFIGRYEDLQSSFQTVCDRLDIEDRLPHLNRSRHAHYSTYYTDRARREVEQRFARDLEMFDYSFEHDTASVAG